jgi:type IV pilus assembly protein PilB
MVGETRDHETAKISVSAAITGHLVLSTLHTNDAVSAIIRMEDMGIEPYLAANSLSGVVAQRLARKVCSHCSQEVEIGKEEAMLGIKTNTVRKAVGCDHCNGTGYKGRVAIHEVVVIDKHIRGMIAEKRTIEEIYQYVEKTQNIRRLKEDMIRLVEKGITTVEELLRLTYGE